MKSKNTIAKLTAVSAISALVSFHATGALAIGAHAAVKPLVGKAGDTSSVARTVEITMRDNYFDIENLTVKPGETIRFVITNAGEFMHEFSIGTKAMHAAHRKKMLMMTRHGVLEPDRINHGKMNMNMDDGRAMRHDDPNSVLLEPGKTAEIVWRFSSAADVRLEFACNVPGHAESGMLGNVQFLKPIS